MADLISDSAISPEHLEDVTIETLQNRVDTLQKQRGLRDWRFLLALVSSLAMVAVVLLWNVWAVLLLVLSFGSAYAGGKVNTMIVRIDREITAANSLLVELLKQKILRQSEKAARETNGN